MNAANSASADGDNPKKAQHSHDRPLKLLSFGKVVGWHGGDAFGGPTLHQSASLAGQDCCLFSDGNGWRSGHRDARLVNFRGWEQGSSPKLVVGGTL
jgi:hypothetical protein